MQAIGDNTKLKLLLIYGVLLMDPSKEDPTNLIPVVSLTDEWCKELAKAIELNHLKEFLYPI